MRVNIEKCEFMREVVECLGFEVGYQWWKPVEDKVAPLLRAMIPDHPVQGVKDIRAFIGSCNFYGRHIRNFTYSWVLLTNLTKKSEKLEWTPAQQSEFERLRSKLASLSILGVPRADGELVFISDASDEGGGGSLYQWQRIKEGAVEQIRSELKTAGIDPDGSLKHTYDCNKFHLVPLGHWNWKGKPARANYSVYERELLAGVLLLRSQTRLLADNPVVWLCNEASTSTFLKGLTPANPRLRSWWVFLSQLRLHIHHIQGVKNELSDYLSCTNFDERLQTKSEDLSKEAFQGMDTQLDLSLGKRELLKVINPKDYEEEYKDVLDKLGEAKYAIIEDVLWSVGSNGLLRNEIRTCVPAQHFNKILPWVQDVEGHPESRSWLWAFNRYFYTRDEDARCWKG